MSEMILGNSFVIVGIVLAFIILVGLLLGLQYLYFEGSCLLRDWKDYFAKKTEGNGLGIQSMYYLGYVLGVLFFLVIVILKLNTMLSLGGFVSIIVLAMGPIYLAYRYFYKKKAAS